mmetsp:Transcript_6433/g.13509  ORF Transcript_6433/g.13509 Transcript_6433/m.13509 type:complete len:536 (-) Transcript_6433:114-1721(-)
MLLINDRCALVAALHVAAVLASTSFSSAFPTEDLVDNVPGLDSHSSSSKWYSGYLSYRLPCMGNRLINTHYVYIEQQVELDSEASTSIFRRTSAVRADESPLIFWSNGGPGASSLYGLLTEMGPYVLNDDSLETEEYKRTGVPTLLENPFTWNKLGSMLIFDAPAPVGFSYCDHDPAGDGLSCGGWDDESSAWNNYHALLKFYEKFPELVTKPLFLSGESYAGIYIPNFAKKIIMHNTGEIPGSAERGERPHIPLKGFAVGDACAGKHINCGIDAPIFHFMFLAGHGQIPLKLVHAVHGQCTAEELHTPGGELSTKCSAALKKAKASAGGFYEYALYDDCTYNNGLLRRKKPYISKARRSISIDAKGALNDYVCGGGEVLEEYVRHPLVKESFHVPPTSEFFDGDNGVGFNYTPTEPNLLPFYYEVGKGKYADEGVRMLVYNGDTDPALDSFQAQNWTMNIGLDETEEWRPWTLDSCRRMGGFITRYEGNFDFVTIRGAGHMVPTNKPEAAYTFFKAWVQLQDYPEYTPECEKPN